MISEIFKQRFDTYFRSLGSTLFLLVVLFVPIVSVLATQGRPRADRNFIAAFDLAGFRGFSSSIQDWTVHSSGVAPNSLKPVDLQAICERNF